MSRPKQFQSTMLASQSANAIAVTGGTLTGVTLNGLRFFTDADKLAIRSGATATGTNWIAIGFNSGLANTTGANWAAIGFSAGRNNTTGSSWTAIGASAGFSNTTGSYWSAVGNAAGFSNTTGSSWTAIGNAAGLSNTTGSNWTAIGTNAGFANVTGANWTAIGTGAGQNNTASGGVFIGFQAGQNETTANKLYLSNSNTVTPLIHGEFDNKNVGFSGKDYGGGSGMIAIADRVTTPSVNPVGGLVLYSEGGKLFVRGSIGIVQLHGSVRGSKIISTPSTTDTIPVSGAAVGDCVVLSEARLAKVTAAGIVTFDSTGLNGITVVAMVFKS